jgi:MYXO-CTERM domain-containing protein
VTVLAAGVSGPAHAEGYRYWSFWERSGSAWMYATQGPATARPDDGDVQGFRFSVSEGSSDAAKPRGAADFTTICGDTPARKGAKRVAFVLDFGIAADAPAGETPPEGRTACALVPEDATSAEGLASVAKPLRYNSAALLCAISGYPGKGCAEQVSGDSASTAGTGAADGGKGDDRGAEESGAAQGDGGKGRNASGDGGGGPSVGVFAGAAAILVLVAAAFRQSRRRQ